MGRVSLTEAYDDRSVISKLNEMDKRVKENTTVVTSAEAAAQASAQAAQETADRFAGSVGAVVQNANAQINASKAQVDQAKAEVDATVTTVAQAVQTANNASASAQQSADTVATYDTRLTAAETKNTQQDTAISALQTADTNNVKLKPAGDQHVSGTLFIDAWNAYGPQQFKLRGTQVDGWKQIGISDSQGDVTKIQMNRDEIQIVGDKVYRNSVPSGADSRSIVNKAYVESTDGVTNNLVHRTTNEKVDGIKTFIQRVDFDSSAVDLNNPPTYASRGMSQVNTGPNLDVVAMREEMTYSTGGNTLQFIVHAHGEDEAHTDHTATLMLTVFRDGTARLQLQRESGTVQIVPRG